jgi:tRNA/tmRNA/rRNA uracil-C5-methylase (TrmA/RlmC/RlmD family)
LDPDAAGGCIGGHVKDRPSHHEQPFARGAEVELEITTLTNMGQGLGRVALPLRAVENETEREGEVSAAQSSAPPDAHVQSGSHSDATPAGRGWVVLVPFALPGEKVRVRVWRNQRNFSDADLVQVLTPSPQRVSPPCPLFTQCGGCQYQHLAYPEQLVWKQRQVAELLHHMARIEFPVNPVIASPRAYGYRSKITPHFARPRPDRAPEIGFLRAGSRHAIVDVEKCPLATDAINARLSDERTRVRTRAAAGGFKLGATLLLRDAADGVTTDAAAVIRERVDGIELRFPAGEFFQNNPFILDAFVRHVRERAASGGARFLVDAYCGSGLFCLTAARAFERAVGIEVSEPSIRWARENATANGLKNCSFIAGDAASIFAQVDFPPAETAIVIDPPRKGSDETFLQQLVRFGPNTVVYVSCNPATQMRDLAMLVQGGYALRDVQPFDLFPQTKHLECVITLTRGA